MKLQRPEHLEPQGAIAQGDALPRRRLALPSRLMAAAFLLPLILTGTLLWLSWQRAWENAAEDMVLAASGTAEFAARLLEGQRLRISTIAAVLASGEEAEALARLRVALASGALDAPGRGLPAVELRGTEGRVLLSFGSPPQAPDGGRPPLWLGQAGEAGAALAVTERRNGVEITVAMPLSEVEQGLRRLADGPRKTLRLVRSDGLVLAHAPGQRPGVTGPASRLPPDNAIYQAISSDRSNGVLEGPGQPAGEQRIAAFQQVQGWPIHAVASQFRSDVLAVWWGTALRQGVVGLAVMLGLMGIALSVERRRAALDAANLLLERRVAERTAEILESEARLRRVQRIGRVGGFEIDLLTGQNYRSAEYMAIQGFGGDAVLERHYDWVSRLHPEDRERAERRFLEAIAPGAPDRDYAQDYRIITPEGETRWIAARAEIERDGAGRAIRMVGAHLDVTDLRRAQEALAASEQRLRLAQDAAGVGSWEWHPRSGRLTWSPEQFALFGIGPEEAGPRDGRAFLDLVHPDDRASGIAAARAALRSGVYAWEFRVLRPRGDGKEGLETRWMISRGRRLTQPDGSPGSFVGVMVDITDRKLAEQRQALLAREVDHRAKNALAVVQAALRLTRSEDPRDYIRLVEGRIAAVARAHTLLSAEGWRGAELRTLIDGELGPFLLPPGGNAPHAVLEGPPVHLPAGVVQPISMALHELATNAVKHGALGVPGGKVVLAWRLEGETLHLTWTERGGPPVTAPPARRGFGSRVLEGTIGDQLGGEVRRHWRAEGLVAEFSLPLGGKEAERG